MVILGQRTLYAQVRETLTRRIANGEWPKGTPLPSEASLAAELGVGQGTVRKALDALALDGMVERRQGKGTFVAAPPLPPASSFFRLSRPDGERLVPQVSEQRVLRRLASDAERSLLKLAGDAEVQALERTREIDGRPALYERVTLPAALAPDLHLRPDLPSALYPLYRNAYGLSVHHADERMRAVPAPETAALHLRLQAGTPVLEIDRLAFDPLGRRVEWRLSFYDTSTNAYTATLG